MKQLDIGHQNPRIQCSVCGQWKRLHRMTADPKTGHTQTFFGGCGHNRGGDHLAGDQTDVCEICCQTECKRLARARLESAINELPRKPSWA